MLENPWLCSILCFATLGACAAETPSNAECDDVACLESYDALTDGKSDGAGNDLNDAIAERIEAQYGTRPRRYNGFFNDSNLGERRFRAALPRVTSFVNGALRARGHAADLDEAAVAINFITEGGYFALDLEGLKRTVAMTDPEAAAELPTWDSVEADGVDIALDGFTFFGVDTLVDNFTALRPFLHESLIWLVENGDCVASNVNERGETVRSLDCLTLEDGMYANAGMFAWSREQATLAIGADEFTALDDVGQFFWTTVFFNAGPGTARRLLAEHGVDYYVERWNEGDDHQRWGRSPKFNASWRTASLEFMRQTVFVPDDLPGEGVCRWEDMFDFGNTQESSRHFGTITDAGSGKVRGYFPGMDVEDWIDVSVVETSFALGMCALVTLSELPGDYSLCVRYVRDDGEPLEACSDEPGLADERVMLDLDRFARDDSGQLYITAYRGDAPAAVCDGYELEWSVSIGSCD